MTVDEMDLKMRIAKRAFLMAELTQLCPEREEELNDLATLSDDQQTDRWFEIWTNLDASIRRTIMRSYRAAGQSGELAELAETQSSSPSSLSQSSSSSSQIGHLNLANPAERPIHHAFWHKLEEEVEAGTEQEAVENKVGILNLMAQDFELIHYKGFTLMTHLEHSELIQHSHSHAGITDQDHPKQFFGMAKIGYHATVPSFIRYQSELYNEAEFTQQETNRQSMTDMLYKRIDAHVATHPEHDMKGDVSPEVLKTKKQFDFFRTRISDEEQMRILDQEFAPMWNKIKKIHDEMEAALEKGKSKLGMSKKKRE